MKDQHEMLIEIIIANIIKNILIRQLQTTDIQCTTRTASFALSFWGCSLRFSLLGFWVGEYGSYQIGEVACMWVRPTRAEQLNLLDLLQELCHLPWSSSFHLELTHWLFSYQWYIICGTCGHTCRKWMA